MTGSSLSDSQWYKDAIIYELHVKAFYDSNNDGYGDFPGLAEKLDYVQDLGINCIWLLPFYPSPLRDDGYDIADYRGVHPSYGTKRDVRAFIKEAHRRGIRVITELVVNHTSDSHPWFQASRSAPPGSSKRNFYVWSDTPNKYTDARIIFTDTEKSNWTWDPVAKAYYWHRFFSHQPDLNFDNPIVHKAITRIMRYWLDMGVDGMRLDAIPYLIERDGTNCENLGETHQLIKQWRRVMDEHYTDRIFLAEANQWPSDVLPYFGNNDECHMAFHFPLMPRIFMALHQENRYPITEILKQTPPIPDACQWAIFLRNHDELTLEMVTDEERDYMYNAYAADPRMRINIGIRRRLAPLMEHNMRRIELINNLLFSLPGTPIIYYGDEIGMGDNVFLGDRNGVRTPMQWSSDRNAGFSRADFAQLYSAPIMDPVYGYLSVNVEAQQRDRSSLLNWMKRIIAVRKRYKVFGRGTLEFLTPENRKILAYIRQYQDETVLVVSNLSRHPQPVMLDLAAFQGLIPVEMFGLVDFPIITEQPYVLTLAPHGFYWFLLEHPSRRSTVDASSTHYEIQTDQPVPVVILNRFTGVHTLLGNTLRRALEKTLLPAFLRRQPWFMSPDTDGEPFIVDIVKHSLYAQPDQHEILLLIVQVERQEREPILVTLALSCLPEAEAQTILAKNPEAHCATLQTNKGLLTLYDAFYTRDAYGTLIALIRDLAQVIPDTANIDVLPTERPDQETMALMTDKQGKFQNPILTVGSSHVLKMYRMLRAQPDQDLQRNAYLQASPIAATVSCVNAVFVVEVGAKSEPYGIATLQTLIQHQGSLWDHIVDEMRRFLERASSRDIPRPLFGNPFARMAEPEWHGDLFTLPSIADELLGNELEVFSRLGNRMAKLHKVLLDYCQQHKPDKAFTKARLKQFIKSAETVKLQLLTDLTTASMIREDELLRQQVSVIKTERNPQKWLQSLEAMPLEALGRSCCHGNLSIKHILVQDSDFCFIGMRLPNSSATRLPGLADDLARFCVSLLSAIQISLNTFVHNEPTRLEHYEPLATQGWYWLTATLLNAYIAEMKDGVNTVDVVSMLKSLQAAMYLQFIEQGRFALAMNQHANITQTIRGLLYISAQLPVADAVENPVDGLE